MRVFVAGLTGAIGRPMLTQLLEAGHEVTGMTRSPESAERLRAAGAEAVVCDAFDRDGVMRAVADARPDVVVHQLTALPHKLDLRKYAEAVGPTNKLRREATPILVDAARAAGARRVVAQSIQFILAPEGGWVKDESARPFEDAPDPMGEAVRAALALERAVLEADGIEGVVLRYGFFYGDGTAYARDGYYAGEIRKRRFPIAGKGDGTFSFIHIEDAASATVQALDHGPPGLYFVVDDEPAPMRVWVPEMARALGAKPPFRVPLWLARLVAGQMVAGMAGGMRGASNAKARRELEWTPRYPSWRKGFPAALGG